MPRRSSCGCRRGGRSSLQGDRLHPLQQQRGVAAPRQEELQLQAVPARVQLVRLRPADLEVAWEETNPVRYHVGKESSLLTNDLLIGVGVTDKKVLKVNGHDAYYLVGAKKEVRKSRVYMTTSVLANWVCPQTKRKFVVKASVHRENFTNMEEHLITAIMGIICH